MPSSLSAPTKAPLSRKSSALSGASLLIALQFISRGLTFLVNQILLRYLSPELLGISTQLEVYSISVLFFSRESLRVAIQRLGDDDAGAGAESAGESRDVAKDGKVRAESSAGRTQGIVNLAYISIFLGLVFASSLGLLYGRSIGEEVAATPYFGLALKVYGVAALVELLAEPCFVVVQQKSRFAVRARAESLATVMRCAGTCGMAIWGSWTGRELGVLPFAVGQAVYAVVLPVVYFGELWGIAKLGGFSLGLRALVSRDPKAYVFGLFPKQLLNLGTSLFGQSIFKHLLTQGDTLLISYFATPTAQGVYALAANYGSLIARLLLQPVEETSRNYFGKLLYSPSSMPSRPAVKTATQSLALLLRSYVLLSIAIVAVGPRIAPLLLSFVAGSSWTASGAGKVLGTYCYYIPLLALNGLSEAFVASVSNEADVLRQSAWMAAFSAGFAGAAYVLLGVMDLGAEGLIWANCVNMGFRIMWSGSFIRTYCERNGGSFGVMELLPKTATVPLAVVTYAVLGRLELINNFVSLVKSGLVAVGFVGLLAISEREHLLECYRAMRGPSEAEAEAEKKK